jgi:dienelactone hydrolase
MVRFRLCAAALLVVAAQSFLAQSAITVTRVSERGLVAKLYTPSAAANHPGVLVFGGSEGGLEWCETWGEPLAWRGYAVLALAYFGVDKLPPSLSEIPIEYFVTALEWLRAQPRIDPQHIAVIASSKGSEAALLVASIRPEIRAVVAGVPSHVVWQGMSSTLSVRSSWTLHGKPVPFVPYDNSAPFTNTLDLYTRSLTNQKRAEAEIAVERINGSLLLFSARADRLWPSTMMANAIIDRLKQRDFRFEYEHVVYDDADHSVFGPRERPGTTAQTRYRADAFQKTVAFLDRQLRRQPRE